MKEYVLGFLFSPDLGDVLLIRKERPEWQKGLLNGVGGRVEEGESYLAAMQREFLEEAGIWVGEWEDFCCLMGNDFKIICFASMKEFEGKYMSLTDEEVVVKPCEHLGPRVVPSTKWLVPMAKDYFLSGKGFGGLAIYRNL